MSDTISTTAEAVEATAIPRRIEVHTDAKEAAAAQNLPDAVNKKPLKQKSPAEWAYERLILYIQNFEEQLDEEHELAMAMTGSGAGVLKIEGLGFFDPDMVTFYGKDGTGARTQLIQHVSQLSVILRAAPIPSKKEPARRIGFQLARELEKDEA